MTAQVIPLRPTQDHEPADLARRLERRARARKIIVEARAELVRLDEAIAAAEGLGRAQLLHRRSSIVGAIRAAGGAL